MTAESPRLRRTRPFVRVSLADPLGRDANGELGRFEKQGPPTAGTGGCGGTALVLLICLPTDIPKRGNSAPWECVARSRFRSTGDCLAPGRALRQELAATTDVRLPSGRCPVGLASEFDHAAGALGDWYVPRACGGPTYGLGAHGVASGMDRVCEPPNRRRHGCDAAGPTVPNHRLRPLDRSEAVTQPRWDPVLVKS